MLFVLVSISVFLFVFCFVYVFCGFVTFHVVFRVFSSSSTNFRRAAEGGGTGSPSIALHYVDPEKLLVSDVDIDSAGTRFHVCFAL